MAEPTIQLGGGNWAGKTDNLLGYYKEGERFYKQDFTFSRSTTGTYTDSDGYIQEMPYNLLQQSNNFDTTWTNSNTTETSGQSGYDGTNNAWLLEKSAANGYLMNNYVFKGFPYTFSTYLKKGSKEWAMIFMGGKVAFFNLSNGTKGSFNGTSSSIESIGNGWYRCSLVFNYNGSSSVRIYPADGNDDTTGTSGSIYIQNAQLNSGTSAKTYFPTTTRLNMPRVDYLNNSNGSLILEPQRTNLIEYSNFSSGWSLLSGGSIAHNQTVSPDGTQNASVLSGNGADDNAIYDALNLSVQSYTLSVFAKQKGVSILSLKGFTSGALGLSKFNLSNGTIETASSNQFSDEKIENYGNGWYRCSVKVTPTSSGSKFFGFKGEDSDSGELFSLYGAQLEVGSYATTLIKTSGSSVTRNKDACSISNVADRIGQTEGVVYAEIDYTPHSINYESIASLQGTSTQQYIEFYFNSNNRLGVGIYNGGAIQLSFTSAVQTKGIKKIAIAYKANDFAIYLNGVQLHTDNSGSVPPTSSLGLGMNYALNNYQLSQPIKQFQLYNTRLSNSELATLTTL